MMKIQLIFALLVASTFGATAASAQSCGLRCDVLRENQREQAYRGGGSYDPNADAQRREHYRNLYNAATGSSFGGGGVPAGFGGTSISLAAGDTLDKGDGTFFKEARTKVNGRCEKVSSGDLCKDKNGNLTLITKKGEVIPIPR